MVTDPTGAIVPGATVVLTNQGTSYARTVQTTSAGLYVFNSPGGGCYLPLIAAPIRGSKPHSFRIFGGASLPGDRASLAVARVLRQKMVSREGIEPST